MRNALRQLLAGLAPYLSEVGTAVAAAIIAYVAFAFAVEMAMPNSVASVVSPQKLALALLAAALLALLGSSRTAPRRWTRLAVGAAVVLIAAGAAWSAAWYYFGPVPDHRHWLAAGIAFAIALLFAAEPPHHS